MLTVTHRTPAAPADVWAVVADGWTYPSWVVGASRMRAVSADWPQVGATLHHSAGTWPALLDDTTTVREMVPAERVVLRAEGGPVGSAVVDLTLTPDGTGTQLAIREDAVSGPGSLVPTPVRQALIAPRNRETLRRLALMAERATTPTG